jgi:hypothetical protein
MSSHKYLGIIKEEQILDVHRTTDFKGGKDGDAHKSIEASSRNRPKPLIVKEKKKMMIKYKSF